MIKIYIQNNEIFKSKKFWEDLLDKLIKENEQHSNMKENIFGNIYTLINPLTSPGEVVSVFTSPYLSAGAPTLGEAKGLIKYIY